MSLRNGSSTTAGNGDSFSPSVSVDGAQIAFASDATNLSGPSDDNDVDRHLPPHARRRTSTALVSQSCGSDAADDAELRSQHHAATPAAAAPGSRFVTDATNLLRGLCVGCRLPDNNNAARRLLPAARSGARRHRAVEP